MLNRLFGLHRRSEALELMDTPSRVTRAEMVGCLAGLRRVNWWLGGYRSTLAELMPLLRDLAPSRSAEDPIRICDVGTGAGDVAIAIVRRCRRQRIPVRVLAVELNADLAGAAREACARYPEIHVVTADAREILRASTAGTRRDREPPTAGANGSLPARPQPFDIVLAALFLHHFPPGEATDWMGLFETAAGRAWMVNDLDRSVFSLLGIRLVGPLFARNRVFLHDAPLSVQRAYTRREWERMARRAGAGAVRLRKRWAGRVVILREKPAPRRASSDQV